MTQTTDETADSTEDDSPRVLTVVSCGKDKQSLEDGEKVPARLLYKSGVHTVKDRYGRHSHGYYIASAKFGLVHNETPLPEYNKRLKNMSDDEIEAWAEDVADDLARAVDDGDFDAVVFIGAKEYINPIRPHFDEIDADILTPWQTNDEITGNGLGMSWCNEESNRPVNVDSVEEIGEIVG